MFLDYSIIFGDANNRYLVCMFTHNQSNLQTRCCDTSRISGGLPNELKFATFEFPEFRSGMNIDRGLNRYSIFQKMMGIYSRRKSPKPDKVKARLGSEFQPADPTFLTFCKSMSRRPNYAVRELFRCRLNQNLSWFIRRILSQPDCPLRNSNVRILGSSLRHRPPSRIFWSYKVRRAIYRSCLLV